MYVSSITLNTFILHSDETEKAENCFSFLKRMNETEFQ